MRVAYITPEFVTEINKSGLATYIDNIARILADAGNQITIVVKSDIDEVLNYSNNIEVVRVNVKYSGIDWEIPGGVYRKNSKILNAMLRKINKNNKIDIVQYSNWMALGVDRIDIPSVVRISSDLPSLRAANQWNYDPLITHYPEKVTDFLEDISIIRADNIYAPSFCVADIIRNRLGCKIDVIESPFYRRIVKDEIEFGLPYKYILTFGNLNLIKGVKTIGKSIYSILKKNRDLFYVFAGSSSKIMVANGSYYDAIEYLKKCAGKFSDRVIYLGKLDWNCLYCVIKHATICIMPSRIDNLPNSCIEAMAMGKIVIGTKGASFDQLIVDKTNGFLVNIDNADELLKKIEEILCLSDDYISEIGEQARERIKSMSPQIIENRLINFYNQTISGEVNTIFDEKYYHSIVEKYNMLVIEKCPDYCL